jgi:hypothetical protein
VAKDPWHYLSCNTQRKREVSTRHNAVVDALYHAVLLTGGQAKREVHGLQAQSKLRPDMQLVYPGRHVLTDVAVVHPLGVDRRRGAASHLTAAKKAQNHKRVKYAAIATRHDAELLPFVVETCGGLAPDAVELLDVISGAAAEHLSLWSRQDAAKQLLASVNFAVSPSGSPPLNLRTPRPRNCSNEGPSPTNGLLMPITETEEKSNPSFGNAVSEPDCCLSRWATRSHASWWRDWRMEECRLGAPSCT